VSRVEVRWGPRFCLSLAVQPVGSGAAAAQADDDSLMSSGNIAATGTVNGAGQAQCEPEVAWLSSSPLAGSTGNLGSL
jgi:hypothetical protein